MPPKTPGITSFLNKSLRTFPNLICEIPENPVVNISAIWTAPEAAAGEAPIPIKNDEEVMP